MNSIVRCGPSYKMAMYRPLITAVLIIVIVFRLPPVNCNKTFPEYTNNSFNRVESLRNTNFLVGIAERAVKAGNESSQVQVQKCVKQLKMFLNGVESNEIWAIKLIDSFGSTPRSFVWGNNFWFSSIELCNEVHNPYYISLSKNIPRVTNKNLMLSASPFKMHLQMIYFNFTSPFQLDLAQIFQPHISVGVCVPESCIEKDMSKWAAEYFDDKTFNPQTTYDILMTPVHSKQPGFTVNIFANTGLILFILICVCLLLLTVFAEIVHKLQLRRQEVNKSNSPAEPIFGENFIMCFSLRNNFARVKQATAPKGFVPVIGGIKTIACFWVTLFHIYFHSMFARENVQFLYAKLESFALQPVLQACFYVDIFFTISGFLLTYNLLSNAHHVEKIKSNKFTENIQLYMKFALHRHFRLMPIFIITMITSDFVFDLIDMLSPFYMNWRSDLYCKETWWYNLLYINNAVPSSIMCSSWGWYIACEMQFYLFFLAILFVYIKSRAAGKTVFVVAGIVCLSTSFYSYYVNGITFQVDVISTTVDSVYTKPWTRIPPYFSGVFMAWLLYRAKDHTLKLDKVTVVLFWCLAVVVCFLTAYMSYWKRTPTWLVAGIMSIGKLLFGVFVGCLISICHLGHGGIFAKAMGAKCFLFLNKFSFSVYMIAPVVISALFGLRTEATKFNELASASDIFAVIMITLFFSFAATLFIEVPFQRLSTRYILKKV